MTENHFVDETSHPEVSQKISDFFILIINDHLSADPTIECNDYYLDLIHENTKYYVVVNNVLKFEVEPEKLTAETIRWTAITISARCISQGGLICSL